MGKNKSISHKHIETQNSKGDKIKVFYSNHYNEHSYVVIQINGKPVMIGGAWETLENAIKSTEK
jgi:hypothetical protein